MFRASNSGSQYIELRPLLGRYPQPTILHRQLHDDRDTTVVLTRPAPLPGRDGRTMRLSPGTVRAMGERRNRLTMEGRSQGACAHEAMG
jgi:hypothetical protein